MATYVPRVLVCGDATKFRQAIGDRPVEVVGQIFLRRVDGAIKLFYDEREITAEELRRLLDGTAEYLLFVDDHKLCYYLNDFPLNTQVINAVAFAKKNRDGFSSLKMLAMLNNVLNEKFSGRVFDFDCCLAKSDFKVFDELTATVDCVAENFGGVHPIHENVYKKIYRTFDECKYHLFDAVILSKERTPDEFVNALIKLDNLSEKILAFVRKNSALESWLNASKNIFAEVETFAVENGAWCLLKKNLPPADLGVYIVTHKDAKLDTPPDGYKIIHAGHAIFKTNFGYICDDTGENISLLNRYLDEVTALYWIWKNTSHTHAGIVHYRRFFTRNTYQSKNFFDVKDILSAKEILKLLDEYDIIVSAEHITSRTQRDLMFYSTAQPELIAAAEEIVRKHLTRAQPDYLDAFDEILNSFVFFVCGIFITRRNILDDYCKWLFSFMLDATVEMRDTVTLGGQKLEVVPHEYSRMMSFFAERMLTVWLMKNHLRIKTLPVIFRKDV